MANQQLWSQDSFVQGELSPLMYARASVAQYYNALKTGKNIITYPQGCAVKRFGTLYLAKLEGFTSYKDIFFQSFTYLNECVYIVLFYQDTIKIYVEGYLVYTVSSTGLLPVDIQNLDYTILQRDFIVTGATFSPKHLRRTNDAVRTISSVANNEFTLDNPIAADLPLPIRFTTSDTLPTTSPQIKAGITYFSFSTSTTTMKIYQNIEDAANQQNEMILTNVGVGTNNIIRLNNWTFTNIVFKNQPIYDFDGGYNGITFTPSALTGAAVTITLSAGITPALDNRFIGGAFIGNGGFSRITNVASGTSFTVAVSEPFNSLAAISGKLALLAEPAWSLARGYPKKASSYQNRAIFANNDSLTNGVWLSAINDYTDFNNLEQDDDDAISWYPSSDEVNYIKFIVPYRSITVHTNTGVYSSPLGSEVPVTPKSFALNLQDSTPADRLKPRSIDNQILIVSGNDVHNLAWEGNDSAYTSGIISAMNEHLIRNPIDETTFNDLRRAGSRYMFLSNEDGSLAIYQTLTTQQVSGWTISETAQSYGNSYFRYSASSPLGRCWWVVEREIADEKTPIAISNFTANTLTATASSFDTTRATAVLFTTTGTLPSSSPTLAVDTWHWVIGIDANTFYVYLSQEDANNDENRITFTDAGVDSNVVPYKLETNFFLEELSFDVKLDCATKYSGAATDTITGQERFNAQSVKMVGDGYGFNTTGLNDEIIFKSHGKAVEVTNAYIGFPIETVIEPLPLSMARGTNIKTTTLVQPTHIRSVRFMLNNTIGGTINGVPIALKKFSETNFGEPPKPANGIFEMSILQGWDNFNNPTFKIVHNEPFDIQLLGVFYTVDVS